MIFKKWLSTVARNVVWLAAAEVGVKGGLFLSGLIVARGLGPEAMGVFTVSYGVALVLTLLFAGGQVEVLIREVARTPAAWGELLNRAQSFQNKLALFVFPIAVVGVVALPKGQLRLAILTFLAYALLRSRLITIGAVFKGRDHMEIEAMARGIELTLALPLVGLCAYTRWPIWTIGICFSTAALVAWAWIRHRLGPIVPLDQSGSCNPNVVREGLPFLGLSTTGQLLSRMDSFLLAGFGIGAAAIGQYGVAISLTLALVALPQLVAVASYPSLSRLAQRGYSLRRVSLFAAFAGGLLGLTCAVVLVVTRSWLVPLVFGSKYGEAVGLLGALAWVLPGNCAAVMIGVGLAAWRKQQGSLAVNSTLVVLGAIAYAVAIPLGGLNGAAATAIVLSSASGAGNLALGFWRWRESA